MTKIQIKWIIIVKCLIDSSNLKAIEKFKSNTHKEFDKGKLTELTIENIDINNVDEVSYAYIIHHNKEYDYDLIKCHFKLVFNDNQHSENVKSDLFDNKTMFSWQNFFSKGD